MEQQDVYKILSLGLVTLITTVLTIALSIGIMIKGWGVSPQSYGWIIGGGLSVSFLTWVIVSFNSIIMKDND